MNNCIFQRLSLSIETLRFPLIFFIICLHCYTATSNVVVGHDLYFRIIYPLSLWMGETGVPAYFFISGMLLFYSQKSYKQKLKSRVKTLVIPYLFFNSLLLLAYLCMFFYGKTVVILDKNIADFSILDYMRAYWDRGTWSHGNGSPLLCPFWYIRNLIVLVIISPTLYYLIRYTKLLFPLIIGYLWINTHDSAYSLQSLTMFSLGAYFPICDKSPIEIYDKNRLLFISAFIFLAALDFMHLFVAFPFALPIHRLSLIANTFFQYASWVIIFINISSILLFCRNQHSSSFVFIIH